ncbi:hypothetical protein BC831DRAFT_481978 [Entophlyctis helioformis]|nr:hypothetical protein BC831DRAFT_481978 [Entophlyctis helioformis]
MIEDDPLQRANRPQFDCIEEYVALVASIVAIAASLWTCHHFAVRLRRANNTLFVPLMFAMSIGGIISQISNVLRTYVLFYTLLQAFFGISIAFTSLLFSLAQTQAIHIFLSHTGATPRIVKLISAAHIILHVLLGTPMYFSGTLLKPVSHASFITIWFAQTVVFWWVWVVVTDLTQNLVIWLVIGRFGRELIKYKQRSQLTTSTTRTGGMTGQSIAMAASGQDVSDTNDQDGSDAAQATDIISPVKTAESLASPNTLIEPSPSPAVVNHKKKASQKTPPLIELFQVKSRRLFLFIILFLLLDVISVVLFAVSVLLNGPPGSLKMRQSSAYSQMSASNTTIHAAAATMYYKYLNELFSLTSSKPKGRAA